MVSNAIVTSLSFDSFQAWRGMSSLYLCEFSAMTELKIVGHGWDVSLMDSPVLGSTSEGHRLYVTQ